jgi:hypothetical protein
VRQGWTGNKIEQALLMFKNQTALFQDKQGAVWQLFLGGVLPRESGQAAWKPSKPVFDLRVYPVIAFLIFLGYLKGTGFFV